MISNLAVQNLSFRYHKESDWLFHNLNLQFQKSTITAVTGPNGSGKTTFLYALCGIIPKLFRGVFQGNISYSGNDLMNYSLPQISQWMNLLQQDPDHQLIFPIVEQELAFGVENLCLPPDQIESRINDILSKLGIEELRFSKTYELSYGQKKLVALASLLVMDNPVLLLDEPSAGLDSNALELLKQMIIVQSDQGKIIIISDHVPDIIQIANHEIKLPFQNDESSYHAV